jgi:FtsZ-binding cell division protein ZapB
MIDPSFDTQTIHPYPPTMQELELRVQELNTDINRLTSEVESLTTSRNYWQDRASNLQSKVDNLQEYVKDNFDYIDESVSQELVDIFGLEITKDYEVTVTVEFSGTVSVPLNYDIDGLEDSLNASLEFSYYEDGEADFMEDRMTIDWTEA